MNKRNWIESRNSGDRGLSPKESSVLSMTTKTVIEQGHSSLISKPWSCCIVLNTGPWGYEPDPSKTQDHDNHGSQGHGHTQPSVSCPTTGDSPSSIPHGYVVTMHLCAKTHQKNAITGAFPQLQPLAHRSQTRSNSNASNPSPMGLPRAKTENHRGKQSCALFVGPLAVIAGWLETNINNSLR